jgi:exosortase
MGGVGLFFGPKAWRAGAFPLVFLLFMIPIPGMILDPIVSLLQRGSAEVSHGFFRMIGVPVYRDGFLFNLPGLTIEVAKQCSGIRSSISLLLISIITAHLFLKRGWSKGILCLSVVPITIFKNGVRIVSLSLLAAYVDRGILESELHRSGGILIFVLALLLLGGVLWVVKKAERKKNPIPAS